MMTDNDHVITHAKQVEMAQALKDQGYSNSSIAYIMRIRETTVRILLEPR